MMAKLNMRRSAPEQPEAHGSSPCSGPREGHRPATYGQLVTAGETAPCAILDIVGRHTCWRQEAETGSPLLHDNGATLAA